MAKYSEDTPYGHTQNSIDKAEGISLRPTETAEAQPMPDTVEKLWVAEEYDQRGYEQIHLHAAEGLSLARPDQIKAASLTDRVAVVRDLTAMSRETCKALHEGHLRTEKALRPYVRRPHGAKTLYYVVMSALLLGVVAGISGALILRGEVVYLALAQSISAAFATVVSGFIGRDIRDLERHHYRRRDPYGLPAELKEFWHLFQGSKPAGERIVRQVVLLAGFLALFIGTAIFALGAAVGGFAGGAVFGLFALAICLGSFVNAYMFADDVADLIDTTARAARKAAKDVNRLSKTRDLKEQNSAAASAESIKAEYDKRGSAALTQFQALKYLIHRNNPQVAGHGRRARGPAGPSVVSKGDVDVSSNGTNPRVDQ
jgi:hypothetical protein